MTFRQTRVRVSHVMSHDLTSPYVWSLSSTKYAIANVLPLHGGCYGREMEVGGGAMRGREQGEGEGKEKKERGNYFHYSNYSTS